MPHRRATSLTFPKGAPSIPSRRIRVAMLAQHRPGHQWTPETQSEQQSRTAPMSRSSRRSGSSSGGATGAAEKQLARLQARIAPAVLFHTVDTALRARRVPIKVAATTGTHFSALRAQDAFVDAIDRASAAVTAPGDAQSRELRSLSNVRCVPAAGCPRPVFNGQPRENAGTSPPLLAFPPRPVAHGHAAGARQCRL